MKNKLADLYSQILLNEAEKSSLEQPSNNTVGKLPSENLFGKKPEVKGTEGARDAKVDSAKELKHDVDEEGDVETNPAKDSDSGEPEKTPSKSSDSKYTGGKPRTVVGDSLGAFETLFKKTLFTENEEETESMSDNEEHEEEVKDEEEKEVGELESAEEEESDLLSDLKSLHDRVGEIISKLEAAVEDGETVSGSDEGQEYDEQDFNNEFGSQDMGSEEDHTMPAAESLTVEKKGSLKGSNLTKHSNNKLSNLKPKSGKANSSTTGADSKFKPLKDGKKAVMNKNNKVSASKVPGTNKVVFE